VGDVFEHLARLSGRPAITKGILTKKMIFQVILDNREGISVDKARGKHFSVYSLENGMVPGIQRGFVLSQQV